MTMTAHATPATVVRINAPTPLRLVRSLLVAVAMSGVFAATAIPNPYNVAGRLSIALVLLLVVWVPTQKTVTISHTRMTMQNWLDIPTGNIGYERDLSPESLVECGRDGKWRLQGSQTMGIPVARGNEAAFLAACLTAGIRVVDARAAEPRGISRLRRAFVLLGAIAASIAVVLVTGSILSGVWALVLAVCGLLLAWRGLSRDPFQVLSQETPRSPLPTSRPDAK